jgi:hypothetical protein
MNLEDFIRDSLVQITNAVGQAHADNNLIAPYGVRLNVDKHTGIKGPGGMPIHIVDFDIAVTASRDSSVAGGAKGGIISVVTGSIDSSIASKNESISRLKFSVPIMFNDPNAIYKS